MIIRNAPNIESIILERACFRILHLIAENSLKVKNIEIKNLIASDISRSKIGSLQSFKVHGVDNIRSWLLFVRENPSLKCIEINGSKKMFTKTTIKALIEHPNLKHISFRGSLVTMKEVYQRIKMDHGRLKSIRLTVIEGKDFSFNLPGRNEVWNPQCALLDKNC